MLTTYTHSCKPVGTLPAWFRAGLINLAASMFNSAHNNNPHLFNRKDIYVRFYYRRPSGRNYFSVAAVTWLTTFVVGNPRHKPFVSAIVKFSRPNYANPYNTRLAVARIVTNLVHELQHIYQHRWHMRADNRRRIPYQNRCHEHDARNLEINALIYLAANERIYRRFLRLCAKVHKTKFPPADVPWRAKYQ